MDDINRIFEFTLEELYNAGGIEGMNDLCQSAFESEEGESAGILSGLEFQPMGVKNGLIQVQVIAEVVPLRDVDEDNESEGLSDGH